MAYCRWSEYSDIYCYESYNGYEVHIASKKMSWCPSMNIPYSGQSFTLDTATEAAELLTELAILGYLVPDGVINDLRSEEDA